MRDRFAPPAKSRSESPRDVCALVLPQRGPAGRGAARDASQPEHLRRATAHSERRDSQDLLESLMNNTTDYVYFKDADGRFLQISKAMANAFGLNDPSEAVGKTDYDFFSKDSADVFLENEQEILRTGRPVVGVEQKEIRPDGRETWASTTKLRRTDAQGTPLGTLGISRDITKRKHAEQELQKATDRLTLAALAGGVGIWDYDPASDELTWDDQMFKLYGVIQDQFSRAYDAWQAGLHPEDRSRTDAEMQLALQGEKEFDTEFRVVWPDGTVHHIRAMAIVQRDPSGRALHMVGTHWDITAQKQAEKELREANAKLADAMRRAIDLAVEADAANRAKSQFLANMSHEIRTPMNGVIGMTGLLLDTTLDEEQRRYAETVRTSGESLLALLNDILDFSRIEAGKMDLETLDFDLRGLLDDLTALLATRAQEAGIEFICAAAPDVPGLLSGDAGRLRQVLLNLASNALKFTHQGEVAVRVCPEWETDAEVMLRFSVKDTGIGIPVDRQGFLFEKFTQADASTTRRYGGTGLGLAISKQLAELMGGDIGFVSAEARGSEFWFTARFAKQAGRERGAPAPAGISGFRILVGDDNATSREVLTAQLGAWGARAEEAADGATALRALCAARDSGDPFAAAILDIEMLGMDDLDLVRTMGTDPTLANVVLVPMTSFGSRGVARSLQALGYSAALVKPVRQSNLIDCLSSALAGPVVGQTPAGTALAQPARPVPSAATYRVTCDSHRGAFRILLAEDNITNQQVALGILGKFGYRADAVANGAEAIRSLETLPYDLVLMDVQMPEMDGFEATHYIRDPRSAVLRHEIPIIAMTAHALQGDRQRCLAAGMDDYVVKPVSPQALEAVMERWLPQQSAREAAPAPAGPETAMLATGETAATAPVFDRAGMLARLMGDDELARIVVSGFIADIPLQIESLEGFLQAGDEAGALRQLHTIKGASAQLGGEALRAVALEAEAAGRNGDLNAISAQMPNLLSQVARLREAMSDFADPQGPGPGDRP